HILFFFNSSAFTEIYTFSLHDALPIFAASGNIEIFTVFVVIQEARKFNRKYFFYQFFFSEICQYFVYIWKVCINFVVNLSFFNRSEEHTSELQSRENLVCRLLLEKKKT